MRFTEVFWMETWIEAIITSGVTLLCAFITGIISYFIAVNKPKRIIEELPDDLSKKHDNLSKEHDKLFKEQYGIQKEFSKGFSMLDKSIGEIKAFQEKEEAVRQEAAKHLPQETQLEVLVKQVFENNNALINEKHSLENKILLLEQQISNLQKELSDEKNKALAASLKLHALENSKRQDHDEYEL